MICVIVPAHNEAELIDACLRSIAIAGAHPDLGGETVEIVVVLDSCSDHTAQVVAKHPAHAISSVGRNVGRARSAGADAALARGARWLAFTDADTVVSPDWLVAQLALNAEAVCGSIGVDDWSQHGVHAQLIHDHFLETYSDCDGHRHVHGANLGVSAEAYRRAGGFRHPNQRRMRHLARKQHLDIELHGLADDDALGRRNAAPHQRRARRLLGHGPSRNHESEQSDKPPHGAFSAGAAWS